MNYYYSHLVSRRPDTLMSRTIALRLRRNRNRFNDAAIYAKSKRPIDSAGHAAKDKTTDGRTELRIYRRIEEMTHKIIL